MTIEATFHFFNNEKQTNVSLYCGDESELGWQSTQYGKKYPKPTIEIISKIDLPFKSKYFLTVE